MNRSVQSIAAACTSYIMVCRFSLEIKGIIYHLYQMHSARRQQQCAILQSNRKTHRRARHETSQFLARQNLVLSCRVLLVTSGVDLIT